MAFTTIWHEARKAFGLSCNEYCVVDMIHNLSDNPKAPIKGWCNASRSYLAGELGLTRQSIITILQALEAKGLIERNEIDFLKATTKWITAIEGCKETLQGVKKLDTPACKESLHPVNNLDGGCKETLQEGVKKLDTDIYSDIYKDNIISIAPSDEGTLPEPIEAFVLVNGIGRITKLNIANYVTGISDIIRLSFLQQSTGREFSSLPELNSSVRSYRDSQKPKKDTMVIPTLDEVTAYTIEKKYSVVEAENFFDYYGANGWHIGKRPMVNWKAAIAKWMRSPYQQKPSYTNSTHNGSANAPSPNRNQASQR